MVYAYLSMSLIFVKFISTEYSRYTHLPWISSCQDNGGCFRVPATIFKYPRDTRASVSPCYSRLGIRHADVIPTGRSQFIWPIILVNYAVMRRTTVERATRSIAVETSNERFAALKIFNCDQSERSSKRASE